MTFSAGRWGSVALLALAICAVEKEARACSWAGYCGKVADRLAPGSGATIPANAPGLAVHAGAGSTVQAFELRAGDGGPPPRTTLDTASFETILKLADPLVPGTQYELSVVTRCPSSDDGGPSLKTTTGIFEVGEARAMPTTIGQAKVDYLLAKIGGRYGHHIDAPLTSWTDGVATVAQITIEPSSELTPFLPVTKFSVFVDGSLWASSHYGHGTGSYEPKPDLVSIQDFSRIHAYCEGRAPMGSACEPGTAAPGTHGVEIRAHLAGAASDPAPIFLTVDLACPDAGAESDVDAGDGASTGETSVTSDAGAPEEEPADRRAATASSDDGGCAVRSRPVRSAAVATWLIAGALALIRVSRRRPPEKR
jgi:hypothetical protein